MVTAIPQCPVCSAQMKIFVLRCPQCGTEVRNEFELSSFDRLSEEQRNFLLKFLEKRGNLKEVQAAMNMSYPTAKKKLDELLSALNLRTGEEGREKKEVDIRKLEPDSSSTSASEIVKTKLKQCGGHVTVYTSRGLPCEIYAEPDGKSFSSDKLPIKPPYEYSVFDSVVDLLKKQEGTARKGSGRNHKLGQPGCEENTVVGAIAICRGRKAGQSVYDPVFVIAAVLEWAGIVINGRGELILTEEYRKLL